VVEIGRQIATGCGNGAKSASLEVRKADRSHASGPAMSGGHKDVRTAGPTKNGINSRMI
jgi:hypothetical protein